MLNVDKLKSRNKDGSIMTLTDCASIAATVFDPSGKSVPVTAGIKLDLTGLHRLGLKWEDSIPENLRGLWADNLELL